MKSLFDPDVLPEPFDGVLAARDAAMATVEANAGPEFAERAAAFVLEFLQSGEATAETVVSEGERRGIRAHDSRAWGPVFFRLSKAGLIVKCGFAPRRKGHGTSGGNLWRKA